MEVITRRLKILVMEKNGGDNIELFIYPYHKGESDNSTLVSLCYNDTLVDTDVDIEGMIATWLNDQPPCNHYTTCDNCMLPVCPDVSAFRIDNTELLIPVNTCLMHMAFNKEMLLESYEAERDIINYSLDINGLVSTLSLIMLEALKYVRLMYLHNES